MTRKTEKAGGLPTEFKKYFWDVNFSRLSYKRYPDFVLQRLLSFGNMKAIRWMFDNFPSRTVKKYLIKFGKRQLDKRSYDFWRFYFGLKKA